MSLIGKTVEFYDKFPELKKGVIIDKFIDSYRVYGELPSGHRGITQSNMEIGVDYYLIQLNNGDLKRVMPKWLKKLC
jgi:hypothetical protein